jgi:CIC family chloride channel protein
MAVELTGQWSLLPYVLLCSVIAWAIARTISPHSLYAIATPEPAGELLESGPPLHAHVVNVSNGRDGNGRAVSRTV